MSAKAGVLPAEIGIDLLIKKVRQTADYRVNNLSANKRGPCYSGVYDTVTGTFQEGENFDISTSAGRTAYDLFYNNAHPIIKQRIDNHTQNLINGVDFAKSTAGKAGTHSEIVALDKALKAREKHTNQSLTEADFSTFLLHNRSTMVASAGLPMNRCDNCFVITAGVITILHS